VDRRAHSRHDRLDSSAKRLLLALVVVLSASFSARSSAAGGTEGTEPRDSTSSGGFFARAAARLSLFDWGRSGGGGQSKADSVSAADLDEEVRNLRPYCGCVIDTIIVVGNTHTKSITILREMATKQGTCLDERLIRRDGAFLRGLGYFAEVSIVADRISPSRCRLVVAVGERPGLFMRVPYPVVNYDFEKGISYGATWKVKNFRGLAEDLSISAIQRREKERGAAFSWNVPWFLGRRFRFRADAGAYRRLENPVDADEDYIRETTAGSLSLGVPLTPSLVRQLWLRTSVSFEGRYSRLTLSEPGGGNVRDFYRQNFFSAGAGLEYDSRDNRISPFTGMLHQLSVRRFASVRGLEQSYVFWRLSDAFYLPAGKADRAVIVALTADVREGDLPAYLRMKLGGVRDLRGYSDDQTGTAKVLATIQYRARLFDPRVFRIPKIGAFDVTMNFIAFADNGALMESILDLDRATFHTTAGLGFEIISPFRDILRFEAAGDGTGTPAFYVTAGTDF
jgi:outer membrane protein assembly factor BamA